MQYNPGLVKTGDTVRIRSKRADWAEGGAMDPPLFAGLVQVLVHQASSSLRSTAIDANNRVAKTLTSIHSGFTHRSLAGSINAYASGLQQEQHGRLGQPPRQVVRMPRPFCSITSTAASASVGGSTSKLTRNGSKSSSKEEPEERILISEVCQCIWMVGKVTGYQVAVQGWEAAAKLTHVRENAHAQYI